MSVPAAFALGVAGLLGLGAAARLALRGRPLGVKLLAVPVLLAGCASPPR